MTTEGPRLNLQEIRDRLHSASAHGKIIGRFSVEAAHLTDRHFLEKRLTLEELRGKVESAKKRADQASEDLKTALELLDEGSAD